MQAFQGGKTESASVIIEEGTDMEEVFLKVILSSCKNLKNSSTSIQDDIEKRLFPLLK